VIELAPEELFIPDFGTGVLGSAKNRDWLIIMRRFHSQNMPRLPPNLTLLDQPAEVKTLNFDS